MSTEAQNIAIFEALGYCRTKVWRYGPDGKRQDYWDHPSKEIQKRTIYVKRYTNCLNAMHEAEAWLPSPLEVLEYQDHLHRVTASKGNPVWFATAAQRAEAFLRTLNLWRDDA